MNKNLYWLWLTLKSSLTPVMADKLLEYYNKAQEKLDNIEFAQEKLEALSET